MVYCVVVLLAVMKGWLLLNLLLLHFSTAAGFGELLGAVDAMMSMVCIILYLIAICIIFSYCWVGCCRIFRRIRT